MEQKNYVDGDGIPLGLGMALAQNNFAMEYFAKLSKDEQQNIINHTHQIHSKKEMQAYVRSLVQG